MRALKTAFLRLTNTETWEEAMEEYPSFATEEHLRKFIRIDLHKSIPQPFADFCTRAKLSENEISTMSNNLLFKFKGSTACIVDAKTTELSGQTIMKNLSSFNGAQIVLTSFDEVIVHVNINIIRIIVMLALLS